MIVNSYAHILYMIIESYGLTIIVIILKIKRFLINAWSKNIF